MMSRTQSSTIYVVRLDRISGPRDKISSSGPYTLGSYNSSVWRNSSLYVFKVK